MSNLRDSQGRPVVGGLVDGKSCIKCGSGSGNDWYQCRGACPVPSSPHYQSGLANYLAAPPRVIPAYDPAGAGSFLGLPMCQNRLAVPTWSYAMDRHPPRRIVELGTYGGGFTVAIGVHAWRIGARVVSYDLTPPDESLAAISRLLGIHYMTGDLWAVEFDIAALIREPGTTYVLCDAGDKRRELATFARYLKPGDVIAAHDYAVREPSGYQNTWWGWGEVDLADGERVAREYGLEPFMQEHFDTAAWLAYRKAQPAAE